MHRFFTHIAAVGIALGTALMMVACKPASSPIPGAEAQPQESEVASVMVDSVNYRHDREMKYTLYDLSQPTTPAVGGAIVLRLASGGEKGCCLNLPKVWRPGMKVRVVWAEATREDGILPGEYTRELEIPKYDAPADLYVVFHPEQEVELVVSSGEPGHPEWRGRVKQSPWEQCLALHGHKPCKAALPKQFDTGSYRGYCSEALREKWDNAKQNCQVMMDLCMKDYEDESFCKGILWGANK